MALFQTFKFRKIGSGNVLTATIEHRPAKCSVTLEVVQTDGQKKSRTFKFRSVAESAAEYARMTAKPDTFSPPGFERI